MSKIKYVKITYKNDFDTSLEKGKRPLLRAYTKAGAWCFIEDGNPIVLGYIKDNCLHELLTDRPISATNYEVVEPVYVYTFTYICDKKQFDDVRRIMSVVYFNEDVDLGFDISTMEEVSMDRRIQWDAYCNDLTDINPYDREYLDDFCISTIKNYGKVRSYRKR